jgi:branched-chain amino acid transport system substrate-binding protein
MKKRTCVFRVLFVLTVFGSFLGPISGEAAEPVVVGVLHWEKFAYAPMMKNAFEMARKAVNDAGGINGRPLKLVYVDDQGERSAGEKGVQDLVYLEKAVMLVGGYGSSNTIYTAVMAEKLDRPFLICTAADDRITQRKLKNVFRLNPPISLYTHGLEQLFLERVKPASMGIIYENSAFGTGGALRMMWFCRENDIDIHDMIPYARERAGGEYFRRILAKLKDHRPEVIYMVSYLKDAAVLVKTIRELNMTAMLCGGAGGFTHPDLIPMAGKAAEHLLTATLWTHELNYPETRAFYDAYTRQHGAPPDYHGAEAYSAILVAADALGRAKSHEPEDIRAALSQTDMQTAFGPVTFPSFGTFERQNRYDTMVLQIVNGEFRCVWPENLATSELVTPPNWRQP